MLTGWQTFYQTTGSAAGSLIALLFIVVTLTAGRSESQLATGRKLFTSPTVFNLTLVLLVSALALAPTAHQSWSDLVLAFVAGVGVIYAVRNALGLLQPSAAPHWTDFWLYGAAPAVVCAGLGAAAIATWIGAPLGPMALALGVLSLLALAIRNAWDLITWIAPRRDQP